MTKFSVYCDYCGKNLIRYTKWNHNFCSRKCKSNFHGASLEEVFFKNIKIVSKNLWEWIGICNDKGYGVINLNRKKILAHRFSYIYHKGNIPLDMFVCHKDDNPSNVCPNILYLGTHTDNMRDKAKRNRIPDFKGEKNPSCKLKKSDVEKIRDMYSTGKYSYKYLGSMFKVDSTTIGRLIRRHTWHH